MRKELFEMAVENRVSEYKNKLLNAAGKLADYRKYCMILADLDENYDETLEIYKLEEWYGEAADTIAGKAAHMLSITLNMFEDMQNNAVYELYHVIKDITGFPKEEQIQICGTEIEPALQEEDNFRDVVLDWEEFPYSQNEARDSFLAHLQSYRSQDEDDDMR